MQAHDGLGQRGLAAATLPHQGQGLAAAEDALTGIITVDSYKNIAAKQSTEPVTTQLVAINYANAASLVPAQTTAMVPDRFGNGLRSIVAQRASS